MNEPNDFNKIQDLLDRSTQDLNEFFQLSGVLGEDFSRSNAGTLEDDGTKDGLINSAKQYSRRQHVRAVFAAIEGIMFSMKQLSLNGFIAISDVEKIYCRDLESEISDTGEPTERRAYISFKKNLKFAFYVFCKSHGVAATPDYSNDGFAKLQSAIKTRDRLTHPKRAEKLLVSLEELKEVVSAYQWFHSVSSQVIVDGLKNKSEHFIDAANRMRPKG